jgi:hypothetical protein
MADSTSKDAGLIALIGLAILIYFYLSKPKTALTQTRSGCGCNGQPAVNSTVPTNPARGRSTSSPKLTVGTGWGRAAGDNAGAAAPGSNSLAPGSGANWQGLRQTGATTLTPSAAPNSPSTPVGNGVYAANAFVTGVQG